MKATDSISLHSMLANTCRSWSGHHHVHVLAGRLSYNSCRHFVREKFKWLLFKRVSLALASRCPCNVSYRVCVCVCFLQAGPLIKTKIPKDPDGKQKTFGFAVYKNEVSVPYAMQLIDGTSLYGRTIHVQFRSGTFNRCALLRRFSVARNISAVFALQDVSQQDN